jgi:hypothetical protein
MKPQADPRVVMSILAILALVVAVVRATPVPADTTETYIVLYKAPAVPSDAGNVVASAGGTLVASYDQIGVAIARSSSASFLASMLKDRRVEGTTATTAFATPLGGDRDERDAALPAIVPAMPGGDSLSGLQWDMDQIHAPEAHVVTGGSPSVVVGDIDTGLDYTHPDLAPNVDFANSVSCVGGVPDTSPAAWQDDNGHGTHTAGTIAAAENGIGIVGRPERQDCRDQGRQCRGLLLPRSRRVRLHVGGDASDRGHQQQLLRRSMAVQLPQWPRAARDLEGGTTGHQVRHVQGSRRRRGRRERGR